MIVFFVVVVVVFVFIKRAHSKNMKHYSSSVKPESVRAPDFLEDPEVSDEGTCKSIVIVMLLSWKLYCILN